LPVLSLVPTGASGETPLIAGPPTILPPVKLMSDEVLIRSAGEKA